VIFQQHLGEPGDLMRALDLVRALTPEDRDPVAPRVCGLDPTDLLADEHVELMMPRHEIWLPAKLDRFEQLLDELSDHDTERVRHENAERLWFG